MLVLYPFLIFNEGIKQYKEREFFLNKEIFHQLINVIICNKTPEWEISGPLLILSLFSPCICRGSR